MAAIQTPNRRANGKDKRRLVPKVCRTCGKPFMARVRSDRPNSMCSPACAQIDPTRLANIRATKVTPESDRKLRVRAAGLVNSRIKRGAMTRPDACTECGKPGKVDAHHPDYSKPDQVEFLCRRCHMRRHTRKHAA